MHHSTLLSPFLLLVSLTQSTTASPLSLFSKKCVGSISRYEDVANAIKCTTININAFTVPVATTLTLSLLDNTVVNVLGDITFATGQDWSGPMAIVSGNSITWNGNNHKMNLNGQYWWDGQGSNGGRVKPHPAFKVKISGTMSNVYLLNPPVQAFSVSNPAKLIISGATVDVAAGNKQNGGHNTDGFDVSSSTGLTITGSSVDNQDDCIAINDATQLTFTGNTCNGGHGISIGSIKTGNVVSGVTISNNKVTASANGLRIKTYVDATSGSVSGVTYSGNTITGATSYGVVIEQDYTNNGPSTHPTSGIPISSISFTGAQTSVSVASGAEQVYVLCAKGACPGPWNWSSLVTSGGSKPNNITNAVITGYP